MDYGFSQSIVIFSKSAGTLLTYFVNFAYLLNNLVNNFLFQRSKIITRQTRNNQYALNFKYQF